MDSMTVAEQLAGLRKQAADDLQRCEIGIAQMRKQLADKLKVRDELRTLVRELAPRKRRQRKAAPQ